MIVVGEERMDNFQTLEQEIYRDNKRFRTIRGSPRKQKEIESGIN